ncbi:major tail protein [Clostridium nigeriense]|uniref:major tail protein n=1 Tax=Clostridium nigeriense TaxID=1805470 RepID=UPI003D346D5B
MSKTARKIVTGVEKAYYSILKEDGDTPKYDAAKYLPGLREISVTANEEQATIYAENRLYDSENSLGEIEVTLDFASIDTTDYVALLGKKVASTGGIIESSDDQPPYIALMVEKTLSGGVKEYLTLFKGKLSIPEDKAKTKEGKTEFQTISLNGLFMPLENGIWKHAVKTTDDNFNEDTHKMNWGKTVIIPSEKEIQKLSVTSNPTNGASSVVTSSDIKLTFNNPIVSYSAVLLKNDFTTVTSKIAIDGTNKVVTIKPNSNLTAATKHAVMLTQVKDIYGQILEDTIIDFTTTP